MNEVVRPWVRGISSGRAWEMCPVRVSALALFGALVERPAAARHYSCLKPPDGKPLLSKGDQVEFESKRSGEFVLRKRRLGPLSDGAAVKYMKERKALSVAEIKAAAKSGALRSFRGRDS